MIQPGIVVVTYNSAPEIGDCLDAALARSTDVVVVDNASSDDTRQCVLAHPRARLIANPVNRGFAAAANQGIAALDGDFALLLNPDAVLLTDLDALLAVCRRPGVAAAGGKLVAESGQPQRGFFVRRLPTPFALAFEALGVNRLWPSNPVNRRYRCLDLDLDRPVASVQPAGAFLLFRRDAWRAVGGFDERFHPVWFEDVDFCKRLLDGGYGVEYHPAAVARHTGGHSVRKMPWECRQLYWYASLLRYAVKHFSRLAGGSVCAAVAIGSVVRMLAGICTERSMKPARIYANVVRLAFRHLVSSLAGARNV